MFDFTAVLVGVQLLDACLLYLDDWLVAEFAVKVEESRVGKPVMEVLSLRSASSGALAA